MVDFENDIKQCVQIMQQSGTILYPTETVWGLGCDAMNPRAVDQIFELKQRPREKSLIVLLAEPRDVIQYIATPHPDIISIIEQFEEPTTVVYNHALGFPDNVVSADGSIAIRVTTDPFCKALIKRMRSPLVSTSANISGMPTPSTYNLIDPAIVSGADYVVKYRQHDLTVNPPSRLIRIADDGTITVLRGR
jgi:L-threonylcarbamoyladenylate synthase